MDHINPSDPGNAEVLRSQLGTEFLPAAVDRQDDLTICIHAIVTQVTLAISNSTFTKPMVSDLFSTVLFIYGMGYQDGKLAAQAAKLLGED